MKKIDKMQLTEKKRGMVRERQDQGRRWWKTVTDRGG